MIYDFHSFTLWGFSTPFQSFSTAMVHLFGVLRSGLPQHGIARDDTQQERFECGILFTTSMVQRGVFSLWFLAIADFFRRAKCNLRRHDTCLSQAYSSVALMIILWEAVIDTASFSIELRVCCRSCSLRARERARMGRRSAKYTLVDEVGSNYETQDTFTFNSAPTSYSRSSSPSTNQEILQPFAVSLLNYRYHANVRPPTSDPVYAGPRVP